MDGYITIGTELDTKKFDKQISYVEDKMQEIATVLESEKVSPTMDASEIRKMEAEYERLGNQLTQLKKKKNDLEGGNGVSGILDMLKNAGKETEKNIKSVARWALAILGIRGAYSMVRQAMSTISQYDTQMATNIEYMKYALANALKPVIETLVNLAYKLLIYINMISQAWFGVNLFANSSAKAFNEAKNGLKGANKQAKALKNQLAGFDEMNVLSDTSGGGADAGGGISPSFDLSGVGGEPPKWLKWIIDNKDIILSALAGIASGLLAIKLGLDPIKALGIGIAVAGIVYAIQGLLEYLKDPSWENFGKIIKGIGIALIGVGIAIGSLPVAVAGAIVLIIGLIVQNWEKIKGFLQNGIDWLRNSIDSIKSVFGDFVGNMYEVFIEGLELILNGFDDLFKGVKTVLDGIIQIITGVFTGNWKKAWEGVKLVFKGIFDSLVGIVQVALGLILSLMATIGATVGSVISSAFKGVVNSVLWAIENILNAPIRTINTLIKTINKVPGINLNTLGTFNLPRLAKGGIVNMPTSGVMVGSAIAGERGAEGVIPLTDSQQMALLGEAIGKYITINASITNTMNGRVISRELQKVQNESNFAFNR